MQVNDIFCKSIADRIRGVPGDGTGQNLNSAAHCKSGMKYCVHLQCSQSIPSSILWMSGWDEIGHRYWSWCTKQGRKPGHWSGVSVLSVATGLYVSVWEHHWMTQGDLLLGECCWYWHQELLQCDFFPPWTSYSKGIVAYVWLQCIWCTWDHLVHCSHS